MTSRLTSALALCLALCLGAVPSAAKDDMRTETVRFAAGATGTTITDRIVGRESVAFTLGAEAGQRMQIALESNNGATYFTVFGPGQAPGGGGLAGSDITGPMVPDLNRFDATLPSSGQYTVLVYLYRSAARRGEVSDFTIDISITGTTGEVVEGDYADGLQGGPDYWRVKAAGGLKLRQAPSTGASVVTTLPNGLELRNLGCRMAEGRSWCRVATLADPGFEGWAAADFLVEGSGQVATQLPDMAPAQQGTGDALVAGTQFNATGKVECYPAPGAETQMCDFGVIREGNGTGTVIVTLPDGTSRAIFYDGGVPLNFDKSQADGDLAFDAKKQADGYMVFIGPASFVIPDAVIYGG